MKQTYKLTVQSPMFLSGSNPDEAMLHTASVRGAVRYWLRALLGASISDPKKLFEAESAVMGSTGFGSPISLRLLGTLQPSDRSSVKMLPHSSRPSSKEAIKINTTLSLQIVTRPGVKIPAHFEEALSLFFLLGGLGKRSRRMAGAFGVSGEDAKNLLGTTPTNRDALIQQIQKALAENAKLAVSNDPHRHVPIFPTLHPSYSRIVVGKKPFKGWDEANRALFEHGELHQKLAPLGKASPRRSSSLIAQVRLVGGSYYPIYTAMQSAPPSNPHEWKVINQLLDRLGDTVWGTKLKEA